MRNFYLKTPKKCLIPISYTRVDTRWVKISKSSNFEIVTIFLHEWELLRIIDAIYDQFCQKSRFCPAYCYGGAKAGFWQNDQIKSINGLI